MRSTIKITSILFIFFSITLFGQNENTATLSVGNINNDFIFDGVLDEPFWSEIDSIENLTMVEPTEGLPPTYHTVVRIGANEDKIVVGVICYDPYPKQIVSYSKAKDSDLANEDYIKIIFDTYLDGRTGFIFAVNPYGARYDALVANRGEGENRNWDGTWDAKTNIGKNGWSAEILIPINTLTYNKNLNEWGFNIQRRIQRFLELSRWTGIKRDYKISLASKAGRITNLPHFDEGFGLLVKGSTIANTYKSANTNSKFEWDNSLDITQKITPGVTAQLTFNTDFAETEVDTRRTNLTRFPLFFPEKRNFFLESADIYDFGLGLGEDVIPFFSRRIGLFGGDAVPLIAGGKINGKIENTNFGILATHTDNVENLVPKTTTGAMRIKQNIFEESTIGMIATAGDPSGGKNASLAGVDFTYQDTKFQGDKVFLIGLWYLYNNGENLKNDKSAFGFIIDYPNDIWDINFNYKRIGKDFNPALGFVPRMGINKYSFEVMFKIRPEWESVRQVVFESANMLLTDLNNDWESYEFFTAPFNITFESGDRVEFNVIPHGERLTAPFEISDGIVIPTGNHHWVQYRIETATSNKREISAYAAWYFGSFYTGKLDQIQLDAKWHPSSSIIFNLSYNKNIGRMPEGNFTQDLYSARVQLNFSSDLQLTSFIQYDNKSKGLGTNTRLRWTFTPLGDLFIVYNHNMNNRLENRWSYDSNQLIAKISYGLWF